MIKRIAIGRHILTVMIVAPATAGTEPLLGCFARIYAKRHLAQHPDQTVTSVKLKIYPSPSDPNTLWFGYKGEENTRRCIMKDSASTKAP